MSHETDNALFRALKVKFQVIAAVLVGAAMTSFALGGVVANGEMERTALALPALDAHEPWQSEVEEFGELVSSALGVREHVAEKYSGWILEAATRQDFDPQLIASLVHTESSFRSNVRSHVGAVGPAQVWPDYWSRFCGTADLTDPEQNIYCGAQVLAYYRDRCGDEVCALEAYNIGLYSKRRSAARRYVTKVDRYRTAMSNVAAL